MNTEISNVVVLQDIICVSLSYKILVTLKCLAFNLAEKRTKYAKRFRRKNYEIELNDFHMLRSLNKRKECTNCEPESEMRAAIFLINLIRFR